MGKILRPCKGCGEMKKLSYTTDFCNVCKWKRGEIWILDMKTWEWELVDFN